MESSSDQFDEENQEEALYRTNEGSARELDAVPCDQEEMLLSASGSLNDDLDELDESKSSGLLSESDLYDYNGDDILSQFMEVVSGEVCVIR